MALPQVGLEAVIENLAGFSKGADTITKSFDTINAGADNVGKSFLTLGGHVNSFIGTVSKTALLGVTALGAGILGIGASSISAGSDVAEMQSKFDAVFKDEAPAARKELDAMADSIGRNKYELQGMAAELQDFLVPMGLSRGAASDLSIDMVGLAEDVASFNNLNSVDVLQDFKSALSGETEPVKKYGIVINEAAIKQEAFNLGLGKTTVDADKVASAQRGLEKAQLSYNDAVYKYGFGSTQAMKAQLDLEGAQQRVNKAMEGGKTELTAAEKAQATYSLILKGTTDAQGDATRTAGGWANQMRALKAAVQEAHQELGLKLLPIVTPLLQQFTAMAKDVLPKLVDMFQANVIPVIQKVIATVKALIEAFSIGASGDFGFLERINVGIKSVEKAFFMLTGLSDETLKKIFALNDAILSLAKTIIGDLSGGMSSAGDIIKSIFGSAVDFIVNTVLPNLTKAIQFVNDNWEAFKGAILGVGAALAGASIASVIAGIVAVLGTILSPIGLIIIASAAIGAAWNTNFMGMRDTLTAFWEGKAKPALEDLWKWLQVNIPKAVQAASEYWDSTLLPAIKSVWKFINDDLIPTIRSIVGWLKKNVPAAINSTKAAIKPVIDRILPELIDIFNIIYKWVIKNFPLMQKTIKTVIDFITNLFKDFTKDTGRFWGEWGDEIKTAIDLTFKIVKVNLQNMLDVVTFVMQIITGDWKGAWETIKDIASRNLGLIVELVKASFNNMLKLVTDIMNSIKSKISDIWSSIVNEVKSKVNEVYNAIKSKFDSLASLIAGYASTLLNAARTMMQGIVNGINSMLSTITSTLSTVMTNAVNSLRNAITSGSIYSTLVSVGQSIMNAIKNGISAVTDLASRLIAAVQGAINQLSSAMSSGTIYNILVNAGRKIIDTIRDAATSVTDFVSTIRSKLGEWLGDLVSGSLYTTLRNTGRKIVEEIKNGFIGAQNVFNLARDAIKDWILSWFSPIPEARYAGGEVVDNILLGFYAQRGKFIAATRLGLTDWVAQAGMGLNAVIAPPVNAPALGATGSTSIYNTFQIGGNTINSGMDQAQFEARVLRVIRKNL